MSFVSCGQEKLSLSITRANSESHHDKLVLFLPGGGKDLGKERFEFFQKELAEEGISSASFDFSGVGDSTGDIQNSSLEDRTQQTICVTKPLRNQFPEKEFILYGVSMGGYVGLSVVDQIPNQFNKLILHAPAAYAKEAHPLNFTEEFTEVLQRDKSWENSPSFVWLENYDREVLFLIGEEDNIIPEGVVNTYREVLQNKPTSLFVSVPGMQHNIWENDKASDMYQNKVFDRMLWFLERQPKE